MALIPCPACTHQVSEQAPTCPSCGHPIAPTANTRAIHGGNAADIAKTAGTVAGLWITVPFLARALVAVALVIGFTIWMVVVAMNR